VSQTRRLAAILAADIAGYSRPMGADEEGTLERLNVLRREFVDPKITEQHGRIVKIQTPSTLHQSSALADAPASASPSCPGACKSP
jgi:adenylate cyclase